MLHNYIIPDTFSAWEFDLLLVTVRKAQSDNSQKVILTKSYYSDLGGLCLHLLVFTVRMLQLGRDFCWSIWASSA